jgi:hypothetical protein
LQCEYKHQPIPDFLGRMSSLTNVIFPIVCLLAFSHGQTPTLTISLPWTWRTATASEGTDIKSVRDNGVELPQFALGTARILKPDKMRINFDWWKL